jgi:hypothetical protein
MTSPVIADSVHAHTGGEAMKRLLIASMILLCATLLLPQVVVGEDPNAVPPPEVAPPGRVPDSVLPDAKRSLSSRACSRKELLEAWKKIDFEDVVEDERAEGRQFLRILERMVAEDEKRSENPPKPFHKMTRREQTAELIEQLRDQQGEFSRLFWRDRAIDVADSPAQLLARVGEEAVPQLIESLHDDRFTRVLIGEKEDGELLRIGDCSLLILEQIAARPFDNVELLSRGAAAANQRAALKWWQGRSRKDERFYLIEGTRSGDYHSPRLAERLLERYPESAGPALAIGVRNAELPLIKVNLLRTLREIPGREQLEVFREALKDAAPGVRLQAAKGLLERGSPEGIDVVSKDWPPLPRLANLWDARLGPEDPPLEDAELLEFLVSCDSVKALAAIEDRVFGFPRHTGAPEGNFMWSGPPPCCYDQYEQQTLLHLVANLRRPRRWIDGQPLSRPGQEGVNRVLAAILISTEELAESGDRSADEIRREAGRALAGNLGEPSVYRVLVKEAQRKSPFRPTGGGK